MKNKSADEILLEARGITKSFPGVKALDNVDFTVYRGKVNAIVGENGAGKSTLLNILAGVYQDYAGEIKLEGRRVNFNDASEAIANGIAMIHQELNLIPELSIAENIYLGHEPTGKLGLVDYDMMKSQSAKILENLEFAVEVSEKVGHLRVGQQQMVEIAKALSLNARLIIMDEPTSALSESEVAVLFKRIPALTQSGVSIVYITHKMKELRQLADYITILRDGKLIHFARAGELTNDEVVNLMVGRKVEEFYAKEFHAQAAAQSGNARLKLRNLSLPHRTRKNDWLLKEVSLRVYKSEILGIYGLMGSGRTELLEAIFGLRENMKCETVEIDGSPVSIRHPVEAIRHGVALVPEDRKRDGLVSDMSIAQNVGLASLSKSRHDGLLSKQKEKAQAETYSKALGIKSHSPRQKVNKLSGGNQQKVVLAKWMATNPKILLLDEPTRGIDVNAKNEIYKLIGEFVRQGLAIILVSSELPEIMSLSDRIVAICKGKITAEFAQNDFSEEKILKAALPSN